MAVTNNVKKNYQYDADNDAVLQAAKQKIADTEAAAPVYAGTYDKQMQDMYDRVMNQKEFSYDLNGDALWQQYKDQYTTQGKLAMMDTMGQAAALNGGYGSSYAQNVGQQAYQGYLQQLNDRVPELYQLALDKYNNDYALLKDRFSTTAQMQADEYGKYQDALGQHNIDLDRVRSDYDTAYDRGYNSWLTGEQLRRDDENTAYSKQQDDYNKLASLISSTGYMPTQAEMEAAGMSAEQAQAYLKGYNDSKKTSTKVVYKDKTGDDSGEGETTYGSLMDECREYIRNGASKSYISTLLRKAYNAGHITEAEWKELKEMFVPSRGETY